FLLSTATTVTYPLSLHDALPIWQALFPTNDSSNFDQLFNNDKIDVAIYAHVHHELLRYASDERKVLNPGSVGEPFNGWDRLQKEDRKSTRLNSSHVSISYAVFCL